VDAKNRSILADQFNTCLLDEPIPLRVYKDLKKKEIPRFRPKSLRDYIRYKIKYSISDTLDKTAYDKTDLEDEIRQWFTDAKRDDYIIAQIFQGLEESGWDGDLVAGYLQGIEVDYRQYVRVAGGTAPPQNPQNVAIYSNEEDSDEGEVKSEQGIPDSPDSGEVRFTGRATRGESPDLGRNSPSLPATRTPPPRQVVNLFGREYPSS